MHSRHNYGISMDLILPDGSTEHIFHENVVNGKLISRYMINTIYMIPNIHTYPVNTPDTFKKLCMEQHPKVVITVGIPTAGKSTWIKRNCIPAGFNVISRDLLRLKYFGKDYKPGKHSENLVTKWFNDKLDDCIFLRKDIVLDNTHCKEAYLKAAIQRFSGTDYKIYVKFFDIPLWKAYLRNIKRRLQTGVWIPINVIKAMYTNYKKINKNDYNYDKWNT